MERLHRRGLIGGLGVGLVGFAAPAILRAQEPPRPVTAWQTEGPFYPYDDKPTDQDADADLVIHKEIGPTLSRAIGVN